jgi:hypothetical protein
MKDCQKSICELREQTPYQRGARFSLMSHFVDGG